MVSPGLQSAGFTLLHIGRGEDTPTASLPVRTHYSLPLAWHGNGASDAEPSWAKAAAREGLVLEPRLIRSDQFTEGETWGREGEAGADRLGLTAEAILGRSLLLGI